MPKSSKNTSSGSYHRELGALKPYFARYWPAYALGLFFLILTDFGQIVIPRIVGAAVDIIATQPNAKVVGQRMLWVVGLALLVALGRYGWRNFIIGSARRIENDLRRDYYNKLTTLGPSFYGQHKVGDLMARATNDLHSIRMATGMALIALVDGVFMSLVIILALFINYGSLAILLILPLPLITAMALFLGKLIGPIFKKVQERFARISEHVQETLAGIRVIKSFAKEERSLQSFGTINTEYGKANMEMVRFWGMLFPAMSFIAGLSTLSLLFFGGRNVIDGRLSPGEFVTALAYLGMLLWPAMGAGWVVNMMQRGAASMKRINEVLRQEPTITDAPQASNTPPKGSIQFKNTSYRYPLVPERATEETTKNQRSSSSKLAQDSLPPRILQDVNFTVEQGENFGILGPTGSGKSTLMKLIPRLLDPPENSLLIGQEDIRTLRRNALRRSIAMVPQDIFLFSETIRENILFSKPQATSEELEQAVDAAGLRADLPFFPQGLETQVGEKGVTLSGGQKQRIAIARALIANPEILLLDDALSAVDAETEERILENIFTLRTGRTTVMVSHRVSALARCQRSVVLEEGRITATGTHEELLKNSPFYANVARLQSLEEGMDHA
ncbi:MAG: ABC transporter ATP-binding protein/permease [Spirochaetales bacterium]|nr:ABC transporter ATP-binding protein/permease [Spirochaetales bacterium]